jgi:pSer/pThr/pTyr-binding forkhead associated (FHA) protein
VPAASAPVDAAPEPPTLDETVPEDPTSLLLVFDTGQRAVLPAGGIAVLGRKPVAALPGDIIITVTGPDSTVSKSHARLEHRPGGVWVTDLGSTNGTDLLDESGRAAGIPTRVATRVEDGMRVRLGDRVFTVSRVSG